MLATYAGQAALLKEWTRGAQINTDRNLRLQYLAGMGLNFDIGEQILSSILRITASPPRHSSARRRLSAPCGKPWIRKVGRPPPASPGTTLACSVPDRAGHFIAIAGDRW